MIVFGSKGQSMWEKVDGNAEACSHPGDETDILRVIKAIWHNSKILLCT